LIRHGRRPGLAFGTVAQALWFALGKNPPLAGFLFIGTERHNRRRLATTCIDWHLIAADVPDLHADRHF
jgi:hypothetical protein